MTDRTYPRMLCDAGDRVHLLASHLEINSRFGAFALDTQQAQHLAGLLRATAKLADNNAEAYNHAIERCEILERSLALADAAWDRLIGLLKTAGIILAIGALVGLLNWLG